MEVKDTLGLTIVTPEPTARLTLLGGFSLRTVDRVAVIVLGEARRLLAFLALQGVTLPRALVAGTLWPEVTEHHAHSSLRSALARLPVPARAILDISSQEVGLAAGATVDVRESRALAGRLLDGSTGGYGLASEAIRVLSDDLLPGWYDSWMLSEAEEWRQLRMHALETLADRLVDARSFGAAATAALAAIQADPLRESGHATLMRVHLAEGNRSEAIRQFALYRALLKSELGLEPTIRLRALVDFSALAVTAL